MKTRILAIISFVLLLAMLCPALFSCGSSVPEGLMPKELRFGMSYDEVKALDSAALELKDATSNDGYMCGLHTADREAITEFYGIDYGETGSSALWFPEYAYSFNQNKELYEYYILSSIYSEDMAEAVFNSFVSYFEEKTAVEPTTNETDSELSAAFETEELKVVVALTSDSEGFMFTLVIHDYTHDLDSVK